MKKENPTMWKINEIMCQFTFFIILLFSLLSNLTS
jgi:hypothetical protein